MPKNSLSYRRDDSILFAGRICDRLVAHFGRESVFMDVDSIPFGVNFREHRTAAVRAGHDGKRRLSDPRISPASNQRRRRNAVYR
jgi:hypothetical protein